jgi:hypothetical protein
MLAQNASPLESAVLAKAASIRQQSKSVGKIGHGMTYSLCTIPDDR